MESYSWRLTFRFVEGLELSSPFQDSDACPCRFCLCGKCGHQSGASQNSIFQSFLSPEARSSLMKTTKLLNKGHSSIEYRCPGPASPVATEDRALDNDEVMDTRTKSQNDQRLQHQQTSSQFQAVPQINRSQEYLKWLSPSNNNKKSLGLEPPTIPVTAIDPDKVKKLLQNTPQPSKKQTPVLAMQPNGTSSTFGGFEAVRAETQLMSLDLSNEVSSNTVASLADSDSVMELEDGRRNDVQVEAPSSLSMACSSQSSSPIMELSLDDREWETLVQFPAHTVESCSTNACEDSGLNVTSVSASSSFNNEPPSAGEEVVMSSSSDEEMTCDGFVFIASKSYQHGDQRTTTKLNFNLITEASNKDLTETDAVAGKLRSGPRTETSKERLLENDAVAEKRSYYQTIAAASGQALRENDRVAEQCRPDVQLSSKSGQSQEDRAVGPVDPVEDDLMLSDSDDNETGTESDSSWTSSMSNDNNNRDSTDLGTSDYSETEEDSSQPPSPINETNGNVFEPAGNSTAVLDTPQVQERATQQLSVEEQQVRVCPGGSEAFHHHFKSHDPDKSYKRKRPLCQRLFEEEKDQNENLGVHNKDSCGKSRCGQCSRTFVDSNQLVDNRRSNAGTEPRKTGTFTTGLGQVGSDNDSTLKRVHSGERPYKCNLCSMSFSQTCRLKRHKKTHATKKMFECDQCSMSFTRLFSLRRHKMSLHPGEKSFKCDMCSWSFMTSASLRRHQARRRHGGILKP